MKMHSYYKFVLISFSVIIALIGAFVLCFVQTGLYNQKNSFQSTKIKDTLDFKDSVLNYIFELRLDHPYIVYSQAIIESGNFTSNIWKENNNMFGMKMPERRSTLAIGINKGHAVYRNWKECIIDYALFQSSYLRGLTEEEYFIKIGNSYAEDGSYEKKIREAKNQHKRSIK